MRHAVLFCLLACPVILCGCGEVATVPEQAGMGLHPTLPPPNPTLLPTVNIAPAKGWSAGAKPQAAAGLAVNAFATNLDHPRWLYVLPNGDVLVAETNAPPKPEDAKGIKGWVMKQVMQRAGAGVPSANRITLLRDANGDGSAETRTVCKMKSTALPSGKLTRQQVLRVFLLRACATRMASLGNPKAAHCGQPSTNAMKSVAI